jgi:two-component system, LytTR family, sensor kinase
VTLPHEVPDALVPPLLLQPLVENAVKHGALAQGRAARIDVRAFAEEGRLRLQVRDNGEAYDPMQVLEGSTIGLPNTRARLGLLYGSAASLDLRKALRELVAEVRLPLRLRTAPRK